MKRLVRLVSFVIVTVEHVKMFCLRARVSGRSTLGIIFFLSLSVCLFVCPLERTAETIQYKSKVTSFDGQVINRMCMVNINYSWTTEKIRFHIQGTQVPSKELRSRGHTIVTVVSWLSHR